MPEYGYTQYFESEVLRKRPYLKREWCQFVIENAIRIEIQDDDRIRFWARIEEFGGKYLRVVTLADRVTIHNAFINSGFRE